MPSYELLSLDNINNGAVPELFEQEWKKLLQDIADTQKPAESVRQITIKIKVKPNKNRGQVGTSVSVETKLPPVDPFGGFAHLSLEGDAVKAYVNNPEQESLDFVSSDESQEEKQA